MRHAAILAMAMLAANIAAGANAAATDVLVTNDPLRHPYQITANSGTCQFQGDCAIVFSSVTWTRVVVTHVSCAFSLANTGAVNNAILGSTTTGAENELPAVQFANQGSLSVFGINQDTYIFFGKGEAPRLDVYSLNEPVQNLHCTLSGYTT